MSISPESMDEDISTDHDQGLPMFSEDLGPTLMDPSEEKRLLRARLAQLERQQTMNSRTSSSASFDLVAQNENDEADTLHRQNDDKEPNNDKESTADQQEADQLKKQQQHNIDESAKMEEFQKQQQHNIDESAKMEEFQKQQQHNIDESAKMEEFQKQQQHNIDESAKMEEFQKQQQHNIDESAKMEEFQKQQQHNIDESAKMEEFQKQQQHNIDESAKMEEFQKQQQHNIDESAKMEEFQKQQQHNIDDAAEMEQLKTDYLQCDQKALLERKQQKTDQKALSAPIDQGTSQLKDELSAKMVVKCQNQQKQNIDALTEAQKGNVEIGGNKIDNLVAILTPAAQWRRYDLFRIAGAIVLFIFIIYTVHRFNQQNEQLNEMRLEMAESLKSVQAMVGAELGIGKQFNLSMAAQEDEEQTKLEELKHLREKIKQFELELKEMKQIDPYRIAGAIVLLIFIIYTVHQFNQQKENRLKINAIVVAELEKQKQSNANKFAELEGHQKQNIDALKRNGLTPQNRWDSAACHEDLTLSELDRLIVQLNVNNYGWRSVLAVEPIPKEYFGIFYFEVKMLAKSEFSNVFIGFATKPMPLDKYVGYHEGTFAYEGNGKFWGHEVDGCDHCNGRPYIKGKLPFGVGDVVGCGVNLATRQIIYTKNGKRLDTANLFVSFAVDLFPFVSMRHSGEIEANFGPNFKYKF
ncbi:Ran-binding protein 9 [Globodera pallida]|nr:Ran-binding protein 9 [Globodera pallida]